MHPAFGYESYLLKRQALALSGEFRIFAPDGSLALFAEHKLSQPRNDALVYADEARTQELLRIQSRHAPDFYPVYDVTDSFTGLKVGTLRPRPSWPRVRDEWEIMDPGDRLIGTIKEDSHALGVLRRFLLWSLLPQKYSVALNGARVADLRQRFNLLRFEMEVDFRPDPTRRLDRRLGLAGAVLIAAYYDMP